MSSSGSKNAVPPFPGSHRVGGAWLEARTRGRGRACLAPAPLPQAPGRALPALRSERQLDPPRLSLESFGERLWTGSDAKLSKLPGSGGPVPALPAGDGPESLIPLVTRARVLRGELYSKPKAWSPNPESPSKGVEGGELWAQSGGGLGAGGAQWVVPARTSGPQLSAGLQSGNASPRSNTLPNPVFWKKLQVQTTSPLPNR